ncbi:MAG: putative protease, partial [Thermoproteota archaeon]
KKRAYFMSSTDLNGIHVLKDFINLGIDSIKVEGRMKSHLYAGTMSKVYKEALLEFEASGEDFTTDQLEEWDRELKKVSHRSYAAANLKEKAGKETIFDERLHVKNNYSVVGNVIEVVKDNCIIIEVKKAFETGDLIEILPFLGKFIETKVTSITRLNNEVIERTKPSTLIKIPYVSGVEQFNLIRRKEF